MVWAGEAEKMTKALLTGTDRYYLDNATDYANRTIDADMSLLHNQFLARLPTGGSILDAGCGAGRDLKVFIDRGYQACGIDASTSLVELAKQYSGANCTVGRIEEIADISRFDGIWACASLLHLPKVDIESVLHRFQKALVPGGTLFASVQEGVGEQTAPDGRFFAHYQLDEFAKAVEAADFSVDKAWLTEDTLCRSKANSWINILATVPTVGA
jgi:2-polyprenyl-3-methyl-5-hydroxy-6-metoxy-1,4-benzoquinol methylase